MADVNVKYNGSAIAVLNESGTKTLKTGGKYCQSDIVVEYTKPESGGGGGGGSTNSKVFLHNVTSKVSGTWETLVPADADIAAHLNDSTFGVAWNCLTAVAAQISTRSGIYTNAPISWEMSDGSKSNHGYYMRTSSTGVGACAKLQNLPTVKTTTPGACYVATDGSVSVLGSSSYPLQVGTYQIVVWW